MGLQQIHGSRLAIKGLTIKVLHSLKQYCQSPGDMGEDRHW